MPENAGNKAFTTAQDDRVENGFTDGSNGVTITTAAGKLPNQLKVTISVPTKNPWGAIVGYNSTTIVRSAVAEYQLPQNLGSPQNSYGNDPESASTQPQFWGNLFGPSSSKGKGDAIQSVRPARGGALVQRRQLSELGEQGLRRQRLLLRHRRARGHRPARSTCRSSTPRSSTSVTTAVTATPTRRASLNAAATLTAAQIPGYTGTITPATRYASAGSSSRSAPATTTTPTAATPPNPWTTWTLRAPDISTWDPTNNPIVCQAEFPGVYPETSNDQPNGTISSTQLKTLLQQSTAYPGTNPARSFASFFRQWVQICNVGIAGAGHLLPPGADGQEDRRHRDAERRRLEPLLDPRRARHQLRGHEQRCTCTATRRWGSTPTRPGANTQFYLTRVLPGEAGKTLVLNFFDTGDASQAGDLAVLPPPDSNVTGGVFADCLYTATTGQRHRAAVGHASVSTAAGARSLACRTRERRTTTANG